MGATPAVLNFPASNSSSSRSGSYSAVITRTGGARIPPNRAQPAPAQIARHGFEVPRARLQSFQSTTQRERTLPTPIAPTYNNIVPTDRPALIPVLTTHMLGEVTAIAQALPNDRIALQWDVCQEVIAWEGY